MPLRRSGAKKRPPVRQDRVETTKPKKIEREGAKHLRRPLRGEENRTGSRERGDPDLTNLTNTGKFLGGSNARRARKHGRAQQKDRKGRGIEGRNDRRRYKARSSHRGGKRVFVLGINVVRETKRMAPEKRK